MAQDIVPGLWQKIRNDFDADVSLDIWIKSYLKRLESGKATQSDTSEYAGRIGEHVYEVIIKNLEEETLPDGKLYWNIAERIVLALMKEAHVMIISAASRQLEKENDKKKIGLKPISPKFPEEIARTIIGRTVTESLSEGLE